MAPSLGLLLGLALAADGVELDAGVAGELHGRNLHVFGQPWSHALVAAAYPRVAVVAQHADLQLSAAYGPHLLAPDLLSSGGVDVLHELRVLGRARPSPGLRVDVEGAGASGTSNLVQDARRADVKAGPISTITQVRRYLLEARLGLTAEVDARTGGSATVAWTQGGGSDTASLALLPEQRILVLDASFHRRLTRSDVLELALWAEDVRFTGGELARLLLLWATWRVRLEATVDAWARAGAGYSTSSPGAGPRISQGTLAGEVGVSHLSARGQSQWLALRASPVVDRLTGAVDGRYELELAGEWALAPAWSLFGRSLGTFFRREAGDARLLLLELRLERDLGRNAAVGGGLYGIRQLTSAADLPAFFEAGAFVSASWSLGRDRLAPSGRLGPNAQPSRGLR